MVTVLDWTANGPLGSGSVGPPEPCVLCTKPAIMRSPRGVPCHKTCAEAWLDRRDEATEQQTRRAEQVVQQALQATTEADQLLNRARTVADHDHHDLAELVEQAERLQQQARQLTESLNADNALTLTLE